MEVLKSFYSRDELEKESHCYHLHCIESFFFRNTRFRWSVEAYLQAKSMLKDKLLKIDNVIRNPIAFSIAYIQALNTFAYIQVVNSAYRNVHTSYLPK